MGVLTPFFNLFKPAKDDPQAISKINEDLDIIDTEMHRPPLTVNGIAPNPATRDLYIEEVPLAGNLSSDIAQIVRGEFIERTSGGDASIEDGYASLVSVKGNMIHTGYVPEELNMTVTPAERVAPPAITAVLDDATFEAYVETAGTYTLTYENGWDHTPATYGVTVTNTPVDGDIIVIIWDGVNAPEMTVYSAPRFAPPAITATIDRDTFVAYVSSSGTITLTYNSGWSADPANYGITVTNEPVDGDVITVVYVKEDRGTITPSNPATFNSTGWNLYDNDVGYARVVKYSDEYGYKLGGNYSLVEFATTVAGERTSVTVSSGYFSVPSDGFIFITGGDISTYIYPTWSDWIDGYVGAFETYTVDTIDLTEAMLNFPNGLLAVGAYQDEINLNAQTCISRVERIAYSAENIAAVIASGMPYDADTNYIYVVRETPVTTAITIDGDYSVSDHGIEFFTGTGVAVTVENLYGENLKDKLRTDVLTISPQTLTAAQKAQVQQNLGVPSTSVTDEINDQISGKLFTEDTTGAESNLNNIKMNIVQFRTDWTNQPSGFSSLGMLIEDWNNGSGLQKYIPFMTNRLFYREYTNNTWQNWEEVASNSNAAHAKNLYITASDLLDFIKQIANELKTYTPSGQIRSYVGYATRAGYDTYLYNFNTEINKGFLTNGVWIACFVSDGVNASGYQFSGTPIS